LRETPLSAEGPPQTRPTRSGLPCSPASIPRSRCSADTTARSGAATATAMRGASAGVADANPNGGEEAGSARRGGARARRTRAGVENRGSGMRCPRWGGRGGAITLTWPRAVEGGRTMWRLRPCPVRPFCSRGSGRLRLVVFRGRPQPPPLFVSFAHPS
jgi:hypothetical protein